MNNGLLIVAAHRREEKPGRFTADTLISAAAFTGLFGLICTTWRFGEISGGLLLPAALCGALVSLTIIFILTTPRRKAAWLLCVLAVMLICAVLLRRQMVSGFAALLSQFAAVQSEKSGRIILGYSTPNQSIGGIFAALTAVSVVIGLIAAMAVHFIPSVSIPAAVTACVLSVLGIIAVNEWTLLFYVSLLFLLIKAKGGRSHFQDADAVRAAVIYIAVISAVISVPVILSGLGGRDLSETRAAIMEAAHKARYGGAEQPMPEGRLRGLGGLTHTDSALLTVTMSKPESLYLRSFVGTVYTGETWQSLPAETLGGYSDVFYWLHKNGFNGQNQLSTLSRLLGYESEPISVSIFSGGACRENYIAPYELLGGTDFYSIGDEITRAGGLFGGKSYSYETVGNQVRNAYELLRELERRQDDAVLLDYMLGESAYREFVYETNLGLSDETKALLERFIGQREPGATYEAKYFILDFLSSTVTYNEARGIPETERDALAYFINESREGYSVHYATAAVLALRYLGVPARYVEGYLITPEDTLKNPDGVFTLTGASMHAWAEYYEDGVGWIPFETTPKYQGVMEQSIWQWFEPEDDANITSDADNIGDSTQSDSTDDTADTQANAADMPPSLEPEHENPPWRTKPDDSRAAMMSIGFIIKLLVAVLLAAVVIAIIIIFARRARTLRRRGRAFQTRDNANAVGRMLAHCMEIMWQSGIKNENVSLFQSEEEMRAWFNGTADVSAMLALNREALFSNHKLTDENRLYAAQFLERTLECVKKKWNLRQRLYNKWIRCLY